MNTNLIDILKKRLATGEIFIDEYRLLLLEISDKSFDSELLVNKNTYQKRDTGGGLLMILMTLSYMKI